MCLTENECVNCGQPCLGSSCPNRNVKRYRCDECGDENKLYKFDGEELCENCIISRVLSGLEAVEGSYI